MTMTLKPNRRAVLAACAGLWAAPAFAQDPIATAPPVPAAPAPDLGKTVRVDLKTGQGTIVLELYPDRAPITVANFLKYVKGKRYDGVEFYRAVRTKGFEDTGFIQGGTQNDPKRVLPPIKLEPTTVTGLHHRDGTVTMARLAPNSATSDFVIMVGPASFMDANPSAPGDNLGYAAFGQVVEGMDVVKKILALPSDGHARNPVMKGQILDPPVRIVSARVEP
jgi:peptidyl-prolyl cis-trans isomerase A (cyclophilin A)